MSTFIVTMNYATKIVRVLSISLLIVFYIGTIPVLTALHHHEGDAQSSYSGTKAVQKSVTEKDHPLFCAVCFRLSTTEASVVLSTQASTELVHHPTLVYQAAESIDVIDLQPSQGRAPPLCHV